MKCVRVFVFNFEHISHLFISVSVVELKQVKVSWVNLHNVGTY